MMQSLILILPNPVFWVSIVVDITEISAIAAAAGVLIGVVYYVMDLRHQTKIRKTDLLMRLWLFGSTDKFMDALDEVTRLQFRDYEDYSAKYGAFVSQDPMQRALWRVFNYFGLLGLLVDARLIDLESTVHIIGFSVPNMLHEKLKPIVSGLRRDLKEPYLMQDFEYLCIELARKKPRIIETWKKREQKLQQSKA